MFLFSATERAGCLPIQSDKIVMSQRLQCLGFYDLTTRAEVGYRSARRTGCGTICRFPKIVTVSSQHLGTQAVAFGAYDEPFAVRGTGGGDHSYLFLIMAGGGDRFFFGFVATGAGVFRPPLLLTGGGVEIGGKKQVSARRRRLGVMLCAFCAFVFDHSVLRTGCGIVETDKLVVAGGA